MSVFPNNVFTARETENLEGVEFDENNKKVLFSEDYQALGDEITALEEGLINKINYIPDGVSLETFYPVLINPIPRVLLDKEYAGSFYAVFWRINIPKTMTFKWLSLYVGSVVSENAQVKITFYRENGERVFNDFLCNLSGNTYNWDLFEIETSTLPAGNYYLGLLLNNDVSVYLASLCDPILASDVWSRSNLLDMLQYTLDDFNFPFTIDFTDSKQSAERNYPLVRLDGIYLQ